MELVEQLRMRAEWRDEIDAGTRDLLDDAADALTTLQAREATLIRVLEACRDKFLRYAEMHSAKLPSSWTDAPDNWREIAEKVERNREMAEMCIEALATSDLAED